MTQPDRQARIREIDEALERLRADLTPPAGEPADFVDAGQDLNARQELAGQIEALENERSRLTGDTP